MRYHEILQEHRVDIHSPEFREWFGKSKVVDSDGNPLIVYHGTTSGNFDVFRTMSHFGSLWAAQNVVQDQREGANIHAVYLRIENPFEVIDTKGGTVDQIEDWAKQYLHWKERRAIDHNRHWRQQIEPRANHNWFRVFTAYMKKRGYDGLKYTNEVEDWGHTSWVIFDSNQVWHVTSDHPDQPLRWSQRPGNKRELVGDRALIRKAEVDRLAAIDEIKQMQKRGEPISVPVMLALIHNDPTSIEMFPDAPEIVKIKAVREYSGAIAYIKNPSPEVQRIAVNSDIYMFGSIRGPIDRQLAIEVLSKAGHFIQYIRNPDCELQVIACTERADALKHIKKPCSAAKLAAIEMHGANALYAIKGGLTSKMVAVALRKDPIKVSSMFNDLPSKLQHIAFQANPKSYWNMRKYPSFDPAIEDQAKAMDLKPLMSIFL